MTLDLDRCRICTPPENARRPLYQFLAEQFPSDGPVFLEFLEHQGRLYTWVPYTLYRGEEILGNVSLMPMRVWFEGGWRQIVGIASVATRPQYRGCGVAKRLLQHCLEVVDRQQLPCALFTGLPRVYEGVGFRTVEQQYLGVPAERLRFEEPDVACTELESLDRATPGLLAAVYTQRCPSYTGKLDRDPDYWPLYRMLFNAYPRVRLAMTRSGDEPRGYVRWETENDRLLITELCAEPNDDRLIRALLDHVARRAEASGMAWITLALPPDHFVCPRLEAEGLLALEPPGPPREPFMVRPPRGESLCCWGRLPWSLADKF